jgi:predicted CoA-substrate-specific enzyme activase
VIYAGIDAGSRMIKAVLFDAEGKQIVASGIMDQGVQQDALAQQLFQRLMHDHRLDRRGVLGIVATGYGRHTVSFADTAVTEITCHAAGVRHHLPDARTITDIGGQDSKLICLDAKGGVQDFDMNDRCAAGTGCFLEVVARRLGLSLQELGELAGRSVKPAAISSMCVVFAETEIVGLLAAGAAAEDIAAGVQAAIARRIASMAGRSLESPIIFTGGVALVPGMRTALQTAFGHPVVVAPEPQMTGALGAAILASRQ